MGGAVIELDLGQPWEPEPPRTPRRPPRVPRWLLPTVVTVATLLTVTAAVAPRRWDPVLSIREPNTTLSFGPDDTALVVTQRIRSGRLQAYPPGRTRPKWTVNFPGAFPSPTFVDGDPGLLVLALFSADPGGLGDGNGVQGRDADTGRLLWSRPGTNLLGVGAGAAVVTNRSDDARPVRGVRSAVPGRDDVVEAVDPRTGEPRWTRRIADDVLLGWTGDVVIELALDGLLRLTDMATGELRREARVALTARPVHTYVDGDVVVVYQQLPDDGPAAQIAVGYDLVTGAERWREDALRYGDCASPRYRCRSEPGRLTVTDTASGAVRYRGPGDRFLLRGDRLILTTGADPTAPPATRAYDLRTGRPEYTLPGWIFAGFTQPTDLAIQPLAGSGLLVADLDADTGRLRVLGRTTDWSGIAYCLRGVRYVGCAGTSGVRVWRADR